MPQTQDLNDCRIEDMNLKGMRVSFDKQLPPQEPITMSFTLKDHVDFINAEARVPWCKEVQGRYVYGLSFSNISDDDKDTIYWHMRLL